MLYGLLVATIAMLFVIGVFELIFKACRCCWIIVDEIIRDVKSSPTTLTGKPRK